MILADTGFWVALANSSDRFYSNAIQAAGSHASEGFVCTWPVLTETVYLLGERLGTHAKLLFMQQLGNGLCKIEAIPPDALRHLHKLMYSYRDLPMDLADASLVWLAEVRGDGRILSTDQRDFNTYRWKNHEPFHNLLLTQP